MRAKTKQKSSKDHEYVFRPIDQDQYPQFVQTEKFTYNRFWCLQSRIVYEQFLNGVRITFIVYPEEKQIYNFNSLVEYVENAKGTAVCKSELLQ